MHQENLKTENNQNTKIMKTNISFYCRNSTVLKKSQYPLQSSLSTASYAPLESLALHSIISKKENKTPIFLQSLEPQLHSNFYLHEKEMLVLILKMEEARKIG